MPADPATDSRWSSLAAEVARFLAVGGIATAVSFIGFNWLAHGLGVGYAPLRGQPILAYLLANLAAGWVAWVLSQAWAFRHRDVVETGNGMVRFFALGAATMVIPVLFLWCSRYLLGLDSALADNISANVLGLAVSTAARFVLFRRFVFLAGPAGQVS